MKELQVKIHFCGRVKFLPRGDECLETGENNERVSGGNNLSTFDSTKRHELSWERCAVSAELTEGKVRQRPAEEENLQQD